MIKLNFVIAAKVAAKVVALLIEVTFTALERLLLLAALSVAAELTKSPIVGFISNFATAIFGLWLITGLGGPYAAGTFWLANRIHPLLRYAFLSLANLALWAAVLWGALYLSELLSAVAVSALRSG
jgi:hypothetical protein